MHTPCADSVLQRLQDVSQCLPKPIQLPSNLVKQKQVLLLKSNYPFPEESKSFFFFFGSSGTMILLPENTWKDHFKVRRL